MLKERLLLLAAALSLSLAACSGFAPSTEVAGRAADYAEPAVGLPSPTGIQAATVEGPTAATSAPEEVTAPPTEAPAATDVQPSAEAEAQPPPVKTGFVPTDPQTVQLASGGPQLIEFFAFW